MATQTNFEEIVEAILKRYSDTTLQARWKEAIQVSPAPEPIAFWIRESGDLINIVWLMPDSVADITWYPDRNMSTFIILQYSRVAGFEIRETPNAAEVFGLGVSGDYLVHVHSYAERGGLYWIASNKKEAAELHDFVIKFIQLVRGA